MRGRLKNRWFDELKIQNDWQSLSFHASSPLKVLAHQPLSVHQSVLVHLPKFSICLKSARQCVRFRKLCNLGVRMFETVCMQINCVVSPKF